MTVGIDDYSAGEAQILTTLRLLNAYNANNSARVDWILLNSGNSSHYAILRPGESTEETTGLGNATVHVTYTTIIELWRLYTEAADAMTLQADVKTVKNHFRKYRFLGDSTKAIDARVTGTGDMLERWTNDGGPRWVVMNVNIEWTQQENVTLAE